MVVFTENKHISLLMAATFSSGSPIQYLGTVYEYKFECSECLSDARVII